MSTQPCKKCTLEFDGCSKGNPGRAGAGAVLRNEDGRLIVRAHEGLGKATNNAAEYHGLRLGLDLALREGCTDITVKTDSKLVVNQVQGYWKTTNPKLRELYTEAKELTTKFRSFEISHFDKGFNSAADTQANMGASLRRGEVYYDRGDNLSENEDNSMHEDESREDGDNCDQGDSDCEHGDEYSEDKKNSMNNVDEYSADGENSMDEDDYTEEDTDGKPEHGDYIEHEDGNSEPRDDCPMDEDIDLDDFPEDNSIQVVDYSHDGDCSEQEDDNSSEPVDDYFSDVENYSDQDDGFSDIADYSSGSDDSDDY